VTTEQTVDELLLDCELSRAISEAEKAEHECRLAEIEVKRKELELQESQINLGYELNGHFLFDRGVDRKSLRRLYEKMRVWDSVSSNNSWKITINSIGGDAFVGAGIVDEIRSYALNGGGKHEVEIKVRGLAASAAGMILQAADVRTIGRYSSLMIHRGSGGVMGTPEAIEDEAEWWRQNTQEMVSLFLSRTDKISRPEFMQKIDRRDWYVSASDAIRLGLCDRIG